MYNNGASARFAVTTGEALMIQLSLGVRRTTLCGFFGLLGLHANCVPTRWLVIGGNRFGGRVTYARYFL